MACSLGPGKCRSCKLEVEGKFCTRCNSPLWSDRTCPRCRVYIAPYLNQNQAPLVGPKLAGEKRVAKNLTITDEKVRAMAAKCPDAARVLKEGFPEAFPREDGAEELYAGGTYIYNKNGSQVVAELRNAGNFKGAAIIAKYGYTAQIVTDDQGVKVVAFFKKRV